MLVGVARQVINCPIGHNLLGYSAEIRCSGVHDDISVSALFLNDGKRQAVLLNYDLCGMSASTIDEHRAAVAAALSIPADHVFLAFTHTHSGPDTIVSEPYDPQDSHRGLCRPEYLAQLRDWTVQAAQAAKANAEDCDLRYNYAQAAENMNRRYTFPDRRFLYIPNNKQLAGLSTEYVDRELGILAFRRKGTINSYKAILTNYTCHPLCVGNTSSLLSADFQGVLRRRVEESFADCICVSITGACGDNHPLKPEGGFVTAEGMGNRLAELAIARLYDAVTVDYDDQLRLAQPQLTLPVKDQMTLDMLPTTEARHPDWLPRMNKEYSGRVTLLGIGPILYAGVPGEMVSSLGAMLKWSSPFLRSYILYMGTDCVGYLPATNQFYWGGYEADTSPLAADAGVRIIRKITDAAFDLLQQQPLKVKALDEPRVDGHAR